MLNVCKLSAYKIEYDFYSKARLIQIGILNNWSVT